MADDKYTWYMIHSLAYAAMIRLHQPFIQDDQVSRDKSLQAARSVTLVTKLLTEADFEYLDPLIGVSASFPTRLSSANLTTSFLALLGVSSSNFRFRACPNANGVVVGIR